MAAPVRVNFPVVDASTCDVIPDDAAAFFREYGLLVIRNVVRGLELETLQAETGALVDRMVASPLDGRDFMYQDGVPFRVEYVVDKLESAKSLLGHPFLLRTVEKLQGPSFVPTWDSMVFKLGGAGVPIPWHRDGGLYDDSLGPLVNGRVFNVDIYLDEATMESCIWGLPGSNQWTNDEAAERAAAWNQGGVAVGLIDEGMVPLPMQPGDVIIHSILALHGSGPTTGPLRRVLYYEFRPVDLELGHGPHTADYVDAKRSVLAAAVRHRGNRVGERPYVVDDVDLSSWDEAPRWRYAHEEFWRWK